MKERSIESSSTVIYNNKNDTRHRYYATVDIVSTMSAYIGFRFLIERYLLMVWLAVSANGALWTTSSDSAEKIG